MVRTTARSTSAHLALCTVLALLLATAWTSPALADPVPTDDPAEAGAGWLVSVLTDDPAVATDFGPSVGTTIDVLIALAAVQVAADTMEDIADFVTGEVASYTQGAGFDAADAAYAGATAKLALGLLVADRDPSDVAGVDLIGQLESLEIDDADEGLLGRFSDRGDFDDFSTPLTQSLALLALERAPTATPSDAAVSALVDQACDDGGFPNQFAPDTCTSSVDTTGFAVQALYAVGADAAADAAVAWLVDEQAADGSFASADGINTNSTGLAASALAAGGATDAAAAAADWIVSQQDGCDTASPGAIPFNAEDRGFVELATAQALPGVVGESLATVTSSGARATVPALDCEVAAEEPAAEEAPEAEEATDPEQEADPEETAAAEVLPEEQERDDAETSAAEAADDTAAAQDTRPTRVDAGVSPSSSPAWLLALGLLGGSLVLGGLLAARPRHGQR